MSWTSANGREITDEMIDRWRKSYEQGEFPEDGRTVGGVIMGRPPLSTDKSPVHGTPSWRDDRNGQSLTDDHICAHRSKID